MVKNSFASVGDAGSIPGSGRSPGKGNNNLLQYSCLENSIWQRSLASYSLLLLLLSPTLCDPIGSSPPGSPVPGILQARTLEWVAISFSESVQSCPTPSDPMDCSLLGSFIHGIFQARILEWDANAFYSLGCHKESDTTGHIFTIRTVSGLRGSDFLYYNWGMDELKVSHLTILEAILASGGSSWFLLHPNNCAPSSFIW